MEVSSTSMAAKPEDIQNPSSIIMSSMAEESPRPPQIHSQTNPNPTTFVQTDTSTFKQVVQMLTGSSDTTAAVQDSPPGNSNGCFFIPPIKKNNSFKLYERRQNNNNNNSMFMINTLRVHNSSRLSPESMVEFPKLGFNSPVTPLSNDDFFNKASPLSFGNSSEAEKGFYLHPPSSILTPPNYEPQLLPLFPLTSPPSPTD